MQTDSPIFIAGLPRSGSTFMQHLLSQHPRIKIHGQEPQGFAWDKWLQAVIKGAEFAQISNDNLKYEEPHYAGAAEPRQAVEAFLKFVRIFLTAGDDSPRWGSKSLVQSRVCFESIMKVWPETRWVVCLRDPFRSIESLRNTYDAHEQVSLDVLCRWWTEAVEFSQTQPSAKLVLIDRLTTAHSRQQLTEELFDFLGEEITPEVWNFVEQWPVIHKVFPDDQRSYVLNEAQRTSLLESKPEFAKQIEELGYLCRERTSCR